jgi:putative chitinase
MRLVTLDDLTNVLRDANEEVLAAFVDPLNACMPRFQIVTAPRQAAFIAQAAHESSEFTDLDESLYYTNAERVRAIFKRHADWEYGHAAPGFDPMDVDHAWGYTNQPERFANKVYANRLGNGDEASGDGWKYRGRGLFQITGKDNYAACGRGIGVDLLARPELLLQPQYACLSAAWFFRTHGCNALADLHDIDAITRRVNGPAMLGREERFAYFDKAMEALG